MSSLWTRIRLRWMVWRDRRALRELLALLPETATNVWNDSTPQVEARNAWTVT